MKNLNRRDWLLKTGAATLGLGLAGGLPFPTLGGPAPFFGDEIRIGMNENPYGPSPAAVKAICEAAKTGNRYPLGENYPNGDKLKAKLSEKENLPADYFLLGHGSYEFLSIMAMVYGSAGREVIMPELSFFALKGFTELYGGKTKILPLQRENDFDINLDEMLAAIGPETSMIYLINPNNPTGRALPAAKIRGFVAAVPPEITVFIDEAYIEFAEPGKFGTVIDLVQKHKNVVLCRTFSKMYGLAGMRIGYLAAAPETVQNLEKYVVSFANAPGIAAAIASLDDSRFVRESLQKITENRAYFCRELDRLGLDYLPSSTNFVAADMKRNGADFSAKMRENKVLIAGFSRRLPNWKRFSIGTKPEMEKAIEIIERII